mmetsp:Transcript_11562/g.34430  ORF Transcript_11562/g.34430 Transcript_11562/m.34430 type:complete len:173 (+) Transcript_11562:140-658(+)
MHRLLLCAAAASALLAAPRRTLSKLTQRRAVDYDAELYRSAPLGAPDADLAAWCGEWARRAVLDKATKTVKLTTPVELAEVDGGVKLSFVPTNSGYADKDKKKDDEDDDKWGADAKKEAPAALGQGGVALEADDGRIVARRCDYQGGIIKQMSEDRILAQLKTDVKAGFPGS